MKLATVLSMPDLLERSGFRLRGRNRADCIHCAGHSVGTVSYTTEVAYCHRCAWSANSVLLRKQLGLLPSDPESKRRARAEAHQRASCLRIIKRFAVWRETNIQMYSTELRRMGRNAVIAMEVLNRYPDCEPAWDALARFYHREAELNRLLDWLACAQASPWLENDYSITDLFDSWRAVDAKQ
jgi:hypothetical protein